MMNYSWLFFALGTVVTWGLYGIFLHEGQITMGDKVNGRYKAFLFVGIAYFLVAVLAPLALLMIRGADWKFTAPGMWLSLFAGVLGAVGAFFVLLSLGALFGQGNKSAPAIVMSIIFAGAPVVNAAVSLWKHPPDGPVRWPFVVGIAMAAVGGFMVVRFKPEPAKHAPPKADAGVAAVADTDGGGDPKS